MPKEKTIVFFFYLISLENIQISSCAQEMGQ